MKPAEQTFAVDQCRKKLPGAGTAAATLVYIFAIDSIAATGQISGFRVAVIGEATAAWVAAGSVMDLHLVLLFEFPSPAVSVGIDGLGRTLPPDQDRETAGATADWVD